MQSQEELLTQLKEQLMFLNLSCEAFDVGNIVEAKRIAVILRILLHDNRTCKSLLGQLNLKNFLFLSSANGTNKDNILTQPCLLILKVGPDGSYYDVPFENRPPHQFCWIGFDDWWNQSVIMDNKRRTISRKNLVLYIADQDGGAHVDPGLDPTYFDLIRQNSTAWLNGSGNPMGPNPAYLSVRQISHELRRTLENRGIII